jgi:hypothetical protein
MEEKAMQLVITAIAVVAGMVFSLAVALLVEEFIFGEVFRLFFARQAVRVKTETTLSVYIHGSESLDG